jgi:hypothetical protein
MVSLKLDNNLAPIEILKSGILKFPLDIFGIQNDLIDIIANAPAKVNAFIRYDYRDCNII